MGLERSNKKNSKTRSSKSREPSPSLFENPLNDVDLQDKSESTETGTERDEQTELLKQELTQLKIEFGELQAAMGKMASARNLAEDRVFQLTDDLEQERLKLAAVVQKSPGKGQRVADPPSLNGDGRRQDDDDRIAMPAANRQSASPLDNQALVMDKQSDSLNPKDSALNEQSEPSLDTRKQSADCLRGPSALDRIPVDHNLSSSIGRPSVSSLSPPFNPPTRQYDGVPRDPLTTLFGGNHSDGQKIFKVRLQQFTGVDFHTWAFEFERLLTVHRWQTHLHEDLPGRYPDDAALRTLDLQIGIYLDSLIAPTIKEQLFREGTSVYHTWEALNSWYRRESVTRRNQAIDGLIYNKMKDRNVEEYLVNFRKYTNEIRTKRVTVDELFKYFLLKGLGKEGEGLQQTFANSTMTCAKLVDEIHDRFGSISHSHRAAPLASTMYTHAKGKSPNRSGKKKWYDKNRFKGAVQMTDEQKELFKNTKCRLCHAVGHPMNFCPQLDTLRINVVASAGSDRESSDSDQDETLNVSEDLAATHLVLCDDDDLAFTGLVMCDDELDAQCESGDFVHNLSDLGHRDRWIFDTGASVHICNDEKWFTAMIASGRRFRTSDKNSVLVAEGIGTVSLTLSGGNHLIVDDVYYCPNACQNLMTNIGLNGLLSFVVDNKGVQAIRADRTTSNLIKFAVVRDGQNVIRARPPLCAHFVTRSGNAPAAQPATRRAEPGPPASTPTNPQAKVARPRGRPRKVPIAPSPPVVTQSNPPPDSPTRLASNDEPETPAYSDSECVDSEVEPEAEQMQQEYLSQEFPDTTAVIDDDVPFDDQLQIAPLPKVQTDTVWKEAAKRAGLRNAVDVHLACGHAGITATRNTCILYGIKPEKFNCEVCRLHNLVHEVNRLPSLNPPKHPLEVVHIDFCQPYGRLPGYDSSTTAMVILDEYTGFAAVYCLQSRAQWLEFFKMYMRKAERRHNRSLIELRTDNAEEFKSDACRAFELAEGITHTFTTPYIHENNSNIERLNRSLEQKAIKIIDAKNLSPRYWPEAMLYAAELHNRTVNHRREVPFTKWFNRVCDRKRLEFGTPIVYLKYNSKGKPLRGRGVFYGFARNRKAYRVQDDAENFVREDIYFVKPAVAYPESALPTVEASPYDEFVNSINAINISDEMDLRGAGCTWPEQAEALTEVHCIVHSVLASEPGKDLPRRYNDVVRMKDADRRDRWFDAIKTELGEMVKNKVFSILPRAKATTPPIGTQYVLTIKDGKERARLVARGDWQSLETYAETYSPTLNLTVLRMLFTIALNEGLIVHNLDVRRAYLNANIDEEIFLKIPEGYHLIDADVNRENRNDYVLRLHKALYGLKQAGRLWFQNITSTLCDFGFVPLAKDSTAFVHAKTIKFYVAVYVDDLVVMATDIEHINSLLRFLKKRYEIHNLGELKKILGITVERTPDSFSFSLQRMIESLADRYEISKDARTTTPLTGEVVGQFLNGLECDYTEYVSLLGSLMYIGRTVRPDILIGVVQLAQFQANPRKLHFKRLIHILQYLRNTSNYSLILRRSDAFNLRVYSDASLGNSHDRKSFNGTVVFIGDALVSFTCRKSDLVALSTNESEIIAASESMKDLLFVQSILCALSHPVPADASTVSNREKCSDCPTPTLFVDNTGTISFVDRGFSRRNKYLEVRNAALADYSSKGYFAVKHVQSSENPADCLTKNLRFVTLDYQRQLLGVLPA